MKRILIINGHPNKESFNFALADAYKKGAELSNTTISQINIIDLNFNPNLENAYSKETVLESDLLDAINKVKQAEHIIWIFPIWWSGYPAVMKGFIDRIFLPNIAFKYNKGKTFPEKLLKGKTARMIITSDTPYWYYNYVMKKPAINQLKKGTLEFCGIKPVKLTFISPIKGSSSDFRIKWLDKVKILGENVE